MNVLDHFYPDRIDSIRSGNGLVLLEPLSALTAMAALPLIKWRVGATSGPDAPIALVVAVSIRTAGPGIQAAEILVTRPSPAPIPSTLSIWDCWSAVASGREFFFTYDLRLDGVQVLFGSFTALTSYLGFEGGGFDEVRLIATRPDTSITEITGGVFQALQVDNIEAAGAGGGGTDVPEPMTLGLLGAGLAGIGAMRRKRA